MMSTKTCLPSRLSVDIGLKQTCQVSHVDMCSPSPMQPLMLLLDVDISRLIIYYTDYHDVDENARNIAGCGGDMFSGNAIGVTFRDMNNISTNISTYVASSDIRN